MPICMQEILKNVWITVCIWLLSEKRDMEELGDGETTVNGILTVNPYKYIDELEETCDKLSYMATVDSNRNQIKRLKTA